MLASKKTKRGVFGAVVLASVLAVGGYAFTNTITFTDTSTLAGDGQQTVLVENVSDIHYGLNATDPSNVDSIVVTLATAGKATGTAFVNANDGQTGGTGDNWYTCTGAGTVTLTCATTSPQLTVADVGSGTTPGKVHVVTAD